MSIRRPHGTNWPSERVKESCTTPKPIIFNLSSLESFVKVTGECFGDATPLRSPHPSSQDWQAKNRQASQRVLAHLLLGLCQVSSKSEIVLLLMMSSSALKTYRMLAPMLIELLFGLASEGALRTRIGSLPSVVHLMLLQLPLGPKYFLADAALLRVFSVVNF